jgi:hypothetical protein
MLINLESIKADRETIQGLLEDGNLVGSPILQVNEETSSVTLWFATDQGSFATLVDGRIYEVASGYFEMR